mgnify:CR=1 FL=1
MKKILFLFTISLIFNQLHAERHCDGQCHHDEYEVRYVKDSPQINPVLQQQLRSQNSWKTFISNNPNWFVYFNEFNLKPHRAFGEPIDLVGNNLIDKVNNFINNDLSLFGIPNDIRIKSKNENDKFKHINYSQYYQEVEVLDSRLYLKLSKDNRLLCFGLDVFSDINISTQPLISPSQAYQFSIQDMAFSIEEHDIKDDLKILPVPANNKYSYHLVYEIHLKTRIKQGPANYICYVDANNGDLLMRKNTVMYEVQPANIHTEATLYTSHPFNLSSVEDLVDLKIKDVSTGTNYYTDNNGDLNVNLSVGSQVEYQLEGLYAEVRTNGITPSHVSTLNATNNFSFDNYATIQERTAYWGVNMIHTHLKNIFPTFTNLDNQMETNVDEAGSCNAYFNGSSINFYAEGNGCAATAKIVDVVYHEYGHAINSQRYGAFGMWNGGLNEGYADLWAITLTENPVLGYGWDLVDPSVYVRRYDQDRKIYPQDLVGEVHADGEIIAGAFWDTYLNLGSMPQMIDLFKYTFDAAPDGPNGTEGIIYTDILLEVLYADDNDNNLFNGTPNDNAIVQAFALHGITLLSNAVISHNPISNSSGNIPVNINASIQLTYPWALGSANCYYRLNNSNNWTTIPMNSTGNNYQANIPSQPNGTIIAYYISLEDNFGNESAITPMAANITPIKDANLPFFILVGYELMEEEDFDFNFGFWQTSDPNDNASTGMWEIGNPIGSFSDPSDPSTIVQTDSDHTQGGSTCAFTGNASSSLDGIGANDVDDGHTTLYSPFYDLTQYNNPAFSYWRWYTNSPPSGANPGADWWQVLITDDGLNWYYVENNLSSEINWRRFAFRASDYVNLTNQVQLKFIASDSLRPGQYLDGGSLVEAAIDDLYLYEAQANPSSISINNFNETNKIVKVTDILGREIIQYNKPESLKVLFYIYENGKVEKRIMLSGQH